MSQLQQAGATFRYPIVLTPLTWNKAVKGYKEQRGSTFNIRLQELLHAAAKAHNRHPDALQVHFDLYPLMAKPFRLELVIHLVSATHGRPYLLISLKEEWAD